MRKRSSFLYIQKIQIQGLFLIFVAHMFIMREITKGGYNV